MSEFYFLVNGSRTKAVALRRLDTASAKLSATPLRFLRASPICFILEDGT